MMLNINGIAHERDELSGIVRQVNPAPFKYTLEYAQAQSTTIEMSYLRISLLASIMGYDAFAAARVLELGPGAGTLMNTLKKHCASVDGFDVVPSPHSTVSETDSLRSKWDLLIACDVIEHMPDSESFFDYDFEWAYISIPAMPADVEKMSTWRHFKPDQHLWYFTRPDFCRWVERHGYEIKYSGHTEDLIRRRWDDNEPNISNFVIRRK